MKITIDTKEDSHEEIKKMISMLQALVGSHEETYSNRDIFSEPSPEVTHSASEPSSGVFGNLFDEDKKEDLVEDKEEPESDSDEDVEVIPY